MATYLKLFETHTQYETFIGGGGNTPFVKPNVSYCTEENEVHYNPRTWADEYLTFDIVTEGTIVWKTSKSDNVKTISYSINNGNWAKITSSTEGFSFKVSVGDKVRFKGKNPAYGYSTSSYNTFNGSTASFNVQGNIMSLTNGDSFANATTFERECVFVSLFENANIINAKNLVLPVTTLAYSCYNCMFYRCTNLTTAPTLPATTLAGNCYDSMFNGCKSLTTAPTLPATRLEHYSYSHMFYGCTNLVNAPSVLPATTLALGCYNGMFNGCKSLKTAPELPATILANYCYQNMFDGCSSLNYIKCLATDISASSLSNWVRGVASSGTFVKNAKMESWTTGTSGIPSGWDVQKVTV